MDNAPYLRCVNAQDHNAWREGSLITLHYLNRGAANVVFGIRPWQGPSAPAFIMIDIRNGDNFNGNAVPYAQLVGQVVRVSRGKDKHLSGELVISGFWDDIRPLFVPDSTRATAPAFVVDNTPPHEIKEVNVQLPQHNLQKHLMEPRPVVLTQHVMERLVTVNHMHPQIFEPSILSCCGILLEDMGPVFGAAAALEFKPKWLLQSPNAPNDAIRCRTCAMRIDTPKPERYMCPLRLIATNEDDLGSWISDNIRSTRFGVLSGPDNGLPAHIISSIQLHVSVYLTQGEGKRLLKHLRFLQSWLDPQGVLSRHKVSPDNLGVFDRNLRLAMTLRDCSLFIKIPYNDQGAEAHQITSKLGDLDFKSAAKIVDWAAKEKSLVDNGRYTDEVMDDPGCWLPWVRGAQVG